MHITAAALSLLEAKPYYASLWCMLSASVFCHSSDAAKALIHAACFRGLAESTAFGVKVIHTNCFCDSSNASKP